MTVGDVISAVLLLGGGFLALVAGLGVLRFPDVFARMHAATKPATLGLLLVVIGAAIEVDEIRDVTMLVLIVVVQFLTAPVGAHMVSRAAYREGDLIDDATVIDELAPRYPDLIDVTDRPAGSDQDAGPEASK